MTQKARPTAEGVITVSFSLNTKEELAKIFPAKLCCRKAELTALMQTLGVIRISGNHCLSLYLNTENAAVARKIYRFLKGGFAAPAEIIVRRRRLLRKSNVYMVRVPDTLKVNEIMRELDLLQEAAIDRNLLQQKCCRRSYLRGAFLGCGSVNSPSRTYHLEFVSKDENYAAALRRLLNRYKLNAKINQRKKDFVVYLKDGDAIGHFLSLAGAHSSLLSFENIRVVKDMRNNVNRIVNCETANLRKTVDAALAQREVIDYIADKIGLDNLPAKLRETAELRRRYPEASLQELGQMHDPRIGKSGIRHRLDRLKEMAEQRRKQERTEGGEVLGWK